MSDKTNIEWADSTVNFWSGCTKVSPGCAHCYAETMDKRHLIEKISHWGKGAPRLHGKGAVKLALSLNKRLFVCNDCGGSFEDGFQHPHPETGETCGATELDFHRRRIFSLSRGDWLDEEVPIEWLAEMLDTIRQCDQVILILCTKRPHLAVSQFEKMMKFCEDSGKYGELWRWALDWITGEKIPNNVWLLTSVENQEQADKRIPELLKIPATTRGLSLEPLLGPVSLRWLSVFENGKAIKPLSATETTSTNEYDGLRKLDWLIIGGESGHGARPCNVDWIRSLVRQGNAAGVATFVKQLGATVVGVYTPSDSAEPETVIRILRHPKGGDSSEWPADLRVQEWPS